MILRILGADKYWGSLQDMERFIREKLWRKAGPRVLVIDSEALNLIRPPLGGILLCPKTLLFRVIHIRQLNFIKFKYTLPMNLNNIYM